MSTAMRGTGAALRARLASAIMPLLALMLVGAVPQPPSAVADAAMKGDREAVRALLKGGADVNAAQGDGMTALHWAAVNGDAELTRMLTYAGARLEVVTRNGNYTPLHLAARAGSDAVVVALLDAGASVHAKTTSGGATALHFAAAQGSAASVAALIARGAAVDVRDDAFGQTPLMWAAAYDRTAALVTLLEAGAGIALASHVEDVPERENQERVNQRARNARVAALRNADRPAQASAEAGGATGGQQAARAATPRPAAESRQVEASQGAGAAARAGEEKKAEAGTPQREAAQPARPAAADTTKKEEEPQPLSYGQLVGGKGGLTPLLFAARQGNIASARALLDAGADIDQVSEGDHTSPLLMAMLNGHYDLGLELLARGADPNIASDAGATPLYAAINVHWSPKSLYPQPTAYKQQQATYLDVMTALLDAGADPNARLTRHLWYMSYNFDLLDVNTAGATAFWRAAYATDVEAMKLLIARGADPDIPTLKPAGRRGRSDDSPDEGAPETDPSGLPAIPVNGPAVWPIHAASGVGYGEGYAANAHRHVPDGWIPAVKYLVEELHADINARDHNGYTPLHHAAARGDNELILWLVEHGADVTAVSRRGQTTADMANGPVQRVPPFLETVALLEKLGSKNNNACKSC